VVTLWFGGPDGPRIASHSIGPVWFVIKLLIILYVYVWVRATLPRIRYDQLMDLGWKRLIPGSLAMLLIVAGFQINAGGSWVSQRKWGLIAIGASLLFIAFLWRAIDVGHGASAVETARDDRTPRGSLR
jgi:NADH-quinone oxidoreductase subunit H